MQPPVQRSSITAMIAGTFCNPIAIVGRKPNPFCDPNISPSSVPIGTSGNPMPGPEKIFGKAAGQTMQRNVSARVGRRASAVRISTGSATYAANRFNPNGNPISYSSTSNAWLDDFGLV